MYENLIMFIVEKLSLWPIVIQSFDLFFINTWVLVIVFGRLWILCRGLTINFPIF